MMCVCISFQETRYCMCGLCTIKIVKLIVTSPKTLSEISEVALGLSIKAEDVVIYLLLGFHYF